MSQNALGEPGNSAAADSFNRSAVRLLDEFRSQRPIRAGSLLVTVFGDAIAPHGGTVWLGSLIRVLDGFGINQRLVRTSVFRLARDSWLTTQQMGRRSYYSLTPLGRSRLEQASLRIYTEPRQEWQGNWTMVLLSGVATAHREAVRKELRWLGFGSFSANLMAHPSPDMSAVESRLDAVAENEPVLIMNSQLSADRNDCLRELVGRCWQLDDLQSRYTAFLDRFRPIYQAARRSRDIDPERAFQVRILLVHEYRKILLRDPQLPEILLPPEWDGVAAFQLCRNLYARLAAATEHFLTAQMETSEGPLPPAEPNYFQRFGGLAVNSA